MSFAGPCVERKKKTYRAFDKPLLEELQRLIHNLSLKERKFELIHPKKSMAIEKILQLGGIAIEPLLEALDTADAEARGWIIFLLGELLDGRARIHISQYLSTHAEKIRNGESDTFKYLDSREMRRLIKGAKQTEARNGSEHLMAEGASIWGGEPFSCHK